MIEHAAGDLVVRAQAGVTMDQLAAVLATARQQLALDVPPGPGHGGQASSPTVGGVLATGAAGPRRLRYGTPRDLLIGITVIRPDGTVTKSGGKVVKNVAGYDLGKLYAGSLRDARPDHRGHLPAASAAPRDRVRDRGLCRSGRGRRGRRGGRRVRPGPGGDRDRPAGRAMAWCGWRCCWKAIPAGCPSGPR